MISKKSQTRKGILRKLRNKDSRSWLEKKLWDVFRLYVCNRDGWQCFTCWRNRENSPKTVFQAGHLFGRGKTAIKYNELNVHCQCKGCNFRHSSDPDIYREKFKAKFGQAAYDGLYRIRDAKCKRSKGDIIEMTEYYKRKVEG